MFCWDHTFFFNRHLIDMYFKSWDQSIVCLCRPVEEDSMGRGWSSLHSTVGLDWQCVTFWQMTKTWKWHPCFSCHGNFKPSWNCNRNLCGSELKAFSCQFYETQFLAACFYSSSSDCFSSVGQGFLFFISSLIAVPSMLLVVLRSCCPVPSLDSGLVRFHSGMGSGGPLPKLYQYLWGGWLGWIWFIVLGIKCRFMRFAHHFFFFNLCFVTFVDDIWSFHSSTVFHVVFT